MTRYKIFIVFALLCFSVLLIAGGKPVKQTFPDVEIGGAIVEIEATTKKGYTSCRYFADDYLSYIGAYDVFDGPVSDLLGHCIAGFPGE